MKVAAFARLSTVNRGRVLLRTCLNMLDKRPRRAGAPRDSHFSTVGWLCGLPGGVCLAFSHALYNSGILHPKVCARNGSALQVCYLLSAALPCISFDFALHSNGLGICLSKNVPLRSVGGSNMSQVSAR